MNDFIRAGIEEANKRITPVYPDIWWTLDVNYQEGEPAFLLGHSPEAEAFVSLSIYKDDPYQEDGIQLQFFDFEENEWVSREHPTEVV